MKTIFDSYPLIGGEKTTFFAGAITAQGFSGCYSRIAEEKEKKRVYIIKGGSGTGKSTLIGRIAADAEEDGRDCVFYRCSSDPDSLDAVVIDNRFVVLDGTAPHVWEMQYPGASSEILYMGKYWKQDILTENKEQILALSEKKSEAYRKGSSLLGALSLLEKEQYKGAEDLLDLEKMRNFLLRSLKGVSRQARTGGEVLCRTWTVGMKGPARTNGLFCMADTHWTVEDQYQTAPCFLEMLAQVCREQKVPFWYGAHPVNDRIVEICIPPLSLTVSMAEGQRSPDKTISMRRFMKKEPVNTEKGVIRLTARCMVSLLKDTADCFAEAGKWHGELEEIYKNAMDFSTMNRDTAAIRRRIRKTVSEG